MDNEKLLLGIAGVLAVVHVAVGSVILFTDMLDEAVLGSKPADGYTDEQKMHKNLVGGMCLVSVLVPVMVMMAVQKGKVADKLMEMWGVIVAYLLSAVLMVIPLESKVKAPVYSVGVLALLGWAGLRAGHPSIMNVAAAFAVGGGSNSSTNNVLENHNV